MLASTALQASIIAAPKMGFSSESNLTDVRDHGAVGDGVTDDTEAVLRAHSTGSAVFYPRTGAFYRATRTVPLLSNASSNGAEIRVEQDGSWGKCIFQIVENEKPISITGFVLNGEYAGGTRAEWSHGINLQGAHNVTIENNTLKNVYGDCVYVGSSARSKSSRNIIIRNNKLLGPRRCNVAIVCGEDIIVRENIISTTIGYVAAIDLEPDNNGFDHITNVTIIGNSFETPKTFISAGVNNSKPNKGLRVAYNRGRAMRFMFAAANALVVGAVVDDNTFSSISVGGQMFVWSNVRDTSVKGNFDHTACTPGYVSAKFEDCILHLQENRLCGM